MTDQEIDKMIKIVIMQTWNTDIDSFEFVVGENEAKRVFSALRLLASKMEENFESHLAQLYDDDKIALRIRADERQKTLEEVRKALITVMEERKVYPLSLRQYILNEVMKLAALSKKGEDEERG